MVAVSLKKIFFKQKTAYEITTRLVGSEMCIRDSIDLTPVAEPFGIPYGCLVPESLNGLLLSGRTICVDTPVSYTHLTLPTNSLV